MAVNHLTYQGRNTKDLELKTSQSGVENLSFTLAWSEKYKETEKKCFLPCKAFRQTAVFLDKYFHNKGSEMTVEGHLETEEWEDKDGNKKSRLVLQVEKVHFCGKKEDNAQSAAPSSPPPNADFQTPAPSAKFVEVNDEELPF